MKLFYKDQEIKGIGSFSFKTYPEDQRFELLYSQEYIRQVVDDYRSKLKMKDPTDK